MFSSMTSSWPSTDALRDPRNIIDHYKYWETEAIQADLDRRRHRFVCVLENFAHDFNLATCIRSANAFLARDVWIVGRRRWDRRGAMGTHRYERVHHAPDTPSAVERYRQEGYRIVAIDNVEGAGNVMDHSWAEDTVLVFGQEQIGVSPAALAIADDVLYIPQWGSTRSLNVGVAAGIAMYAYADAVCATPGMGTPHHAPH